MSLIRKEQAHSINGVPGRLHNLHVPPAQWVAGVFANQTWTSEPRKITGYGSSATMNVEMRFDDSCKNRRMSFAITASVYTARSRRQNDCEACGCLHDEIREFFPELAPLIQWHLSYTDGPMHYLANTLYHASKRDFKAARDAANWPEATDEQLTASRAELESALLARAPALIARFREAMESAGFMWEAPARSEV